jgi:hypothetical protein
MFKKILFYGLIVTIIATTILGCKKDTAVVDTGIVRYSNASPGGYRYEIFLDGGSLGLLNANSYYDKPSIPVGSHIVKSVQYEGYALTPTVVEKTISVTKGVTLEFNFP